MGFDAYQIPIFIKQEMNNLIFRKAKNIEASEIWKILQSAIERRREDGSDQWQGGYPDLETVTEDILEGKGYVLAVENEIAAYCALSFSDEPEYETIDGAWLTDSDYLVIHRIAVSPLFLKKGFAKELISQAEQFALENQVLSVRMDTNFDNFAMLRICEQLGYQYCGIVKMHGSDRKAFEKVLKK